MIKKDIFNGDIKEQFRASAKDRLYRFMLADRTIRGAIIHSSKMVNEMRANHELGPLETLVLGQAYIAAGLLSSSLKDKNDRICINIKCSGPVKGFDVEANAYGEVRGFLKTERIEVSSPQNISSLSGLFGAGFLTVIKNIDNAKIPYTGQVALEHGSIAEDLANYFLVSEQIPTGFKLSVSFDDAEQVVGAGGLFLQALPGADPEMLIQAEKIIQTMPALGELYTQGKTPENIIMTEFESLKPQILTNTRVEFFCRCSKEKMEGYLKNLSQEEKKDIAAQSDLPLEIRCHNCNSKYRLSANLT